MTTDIVFDATAVVKRDGVTEVVLEIPVHDDGRGPYIIDKNGMRVPIEAGDTLEVKARVPS